MLSLTRASQLEDGDAGAGYPEKRKREVRWRKKGAPARKDTWLGERQDTAFAKARSVGARKVKVTTSALDCGKKKEGRKIFTGGEAFVQLVQQVGPVDEGKRTKGKGKAAKSKFLPLELEPEDFEGPEIE